jgi:hypothetical protein
MSEKPEQLNEESRSEKDETFAKAQKIVKNALIEKNKADLVKSGGKTMLDKYVELFKVVQEQQFSTKKLVENEIVVGIILEGQIRNSQLYPDNYQLMLKCMNVYQHKPAGVPDDIELDPSEYIIEERREIIFLAKAGCTSVLRQLGVPEPDNGYNLKALSEEKGLLDKLKNRRYSLKYMGLKEYKGKSFNSYVINLLKK